MAGAAFFRRGAGRFAQFQRQPAELRTDPEGNVFDSSEELAYWMRLRQLKAAGYLDKLERQVPFPLAWIDHTGRKVEVKTRSAGFPNGRRAVYHADFRYRVLKPWLAHHRPGQIEVVEYKGVDDPASRLRRAIVEAIYAIEIRMVGDAAKPKKRRKPKAAQAAAERRTTLI